MTTPAEEDAAARTIWEHSPAHLVFGGAYDHLLPHHQAELRDTARRVLQAAAQTREGQRGRWYAVAYWPEDGSVPHPDIVWKRDLEGVQRRAAALSRVGPQRYIAAGLIPLDQP